MGGKYPAGYDIELNGSCSWASKPASCGSKGASDGSMRVPRPMVDSYGLKAAPGHCCNVCTGVENDGPLNDIEL